mgnify:CR=1 FL=1
MARAVAGEADVPLFSISRSEFVEMFVSVGPARVRDLLEQARQAAPCLIFIDELDALGRTRPPFSDYGGGDEKEQTLNQLLAELHGFDPRVRIVLRMIMLSSGAFRAFAISAATGTPPRGNASTTGSMR